LIFEGRKILFISLTRTGSVEYAASLLDKIKDLEPLVICSEETATIFPNNVLNVKTYSGFGSFFLRTLFINSVIIKHLNRFKKMHSNLSLFFPVFHPWNNIIAKWAKKNDIPIVSVIHDTEMHLGEENKKIFFLQKKLMEISDKVVFLTETEKLKAIKLQILREDKTAVISHPIISIGASHQLRHDRRLKILYLGRLKTYKGVDNLLKGLQKLK